KKEWANTKKAFHKTSTNSFKVLPDKIGMRSKFPSSLKIPRYSPGNWPLVFDR
ncbi:unnamed protein product, partial [Dovyalis caffra]